MWLGSASAPSGTMDPTTSGPGGASVRPEPATLPRSMRSMRSMATGAVVASKVRVDPWLLAALAVTVLALVLRATGLDFGLPYHYHWDEPTVMNRVIR